MNMLKIAVVGSFAAGAALALAPVAAADDLTSIVDSEITSLNALFTGEADLAGDSSAVNTTGEFDTIPFVDAPKTAPFTTLDYELYGINPAPPLTRVRNSCSTARWSSSTTPSTSRHTRC